MQEKVVTIWISNLKLFAKKSAILSGKRPEPTKSCKAGFVPLICQRICHLSCELRQAPEWDFSFLLFLYENKTFKSRSSSSFLKSETKSAFTMMFCEIKNGSCCVKSFHIIFATEIKMSTAQWIMVRKWNLCRARWSINPIVNSNRKAWWTSVTVQ